MRRRSVPLPILTPPIGSRFMYGINSTLCVKLCSLVVNSPSSLSGMYVSVRQANFKYLSFKISNNVMEEIKIDETVKFDVFNPVGEIMMIEVFAADVMGLKKRGRLVGYVPVDLSLLPMGVTVTTTEPVVMTALPKKGSSALSSPSTKTIMHITIALTASDFGLENTDEAVTASYAAQYTTWRNTGLCHQSPPPPSPDVVGTSTSAPAGPFGGKFMPTSRYVVDNGYVLRRPSKLRMAVQSTRKAFSSLRNAASSRSA